MRAAELITTVAISHAVVKPVFKAHALTSTVPIKVNLKSFTPAFKTVLSAMCACIYFSFMNHTYQRPGS